MKNVYKTTVASYRGRIRETGKATNSPIKAGASKFRVGMALMLSGVLILNGISSYAQNCPTTGTTNLSSNENTYYPGTQATVAVGATSITLGAIGSGANFGNTPIAVGDIVLIIQIQGAQITVPVNPQSTLYGGNVSGIGSGFISTNLLAGQMEFAVATNAVPVGGGTLNIASGTTYNYANTNYGATGQYRYQVIRVSTHYNIKLMSTITTPKWNGSTGGVTVISAVNQVDFNGQLVDASGAGFRGGGSISYNGAAGTSYKDFYTLSTTTANGGKAEGIAGTPRYIFVNSVLVDNVVEGYPGGSNARGGPANGGGGATDSNPTSNDQNAGGGGGGNGGAGGLGGNGWFSFGFSGGHGGTAFSIGATNYYSPKRLILGGGGGGGSSNNGTGTPGGGNASSGATGGGMVIINATTILNSGTINANGLTGNSTVQIDGSGGGGAGGSILIYANSGQAGITAYANGGDGGSNFPAGMSATQHGPGGGGGGGVIFSNAALNIASSVNPGASGISHGTSVTDNFGAFPGNVGVLTTTFPFSQLPPNMQICQTIVLPVTILDFSATLLSENNVKVSWSTTDEVDMDYFEVERSTDATGFIGVERVDADQTLNPVHNYSMNDLLNGINGSVVYYRLRMVDKSGKYSYSKVVAIKLEQQENVLSVYPNPLNDYTTLSIFVSKPSTGLIRLIDNTGKQLFNRTINVYNGSNSILVDQLGYLPKGIYVIQVLLNNKLYNQKIVKR
jgi:hypothetical protein